MGFFSKVCVKTHKPVVHDGRGFPKLSHVVALFKDGRKLEGAYDGYGRVGGVELCPDGYDEETWDDIKFVLSYAYEGESWGDLGPSYDEDAQGHFMSDDFLKHCMSVDSLGSKKGYQKAFKQLADW